MKEHMNDQPEQTKKSSKQKYNGELDQGLCNAFS